eukprot:SAG31_NODE_295_length_18239_cov_15.063065_4_plen_109_part_00
MTDISRKSRSISMRLQIDAISIFDKYQLYILVPVIYSKCYTCSSLFDSARFNKQWLVNLFFFKKKNGPRRGPPMILLARSILSNPNHQVIILKKDAHASWHIQLIISL